MGLRPTTKKVNGRWYDINQAADRIAELEQQVEALTDYIRNMDDVGGEVMATSIVEWESILAEHGATAQQEGVMGIRETTYCSECLRPKDERIAELQQQLAALTARNKLLETLLGTFRAMIDSAQKEGGE